MRIVLWTNGRPNQVALANKIAKEFDLVGIVVEERGPVHKRSFSDIISSLYERVFLGSIAGAWNGMQARYRRTYPGFPNVPILKVTNINDEATARFSAELRADVIAVSGTGMIREKLLASSFPKGILNLHTGLSPYVKGGPNCTNWCIALGRFHLVGNTIMWIDKGIDSGNLVATECTSFTGDEDLGSVHVKVMEHAHDLYLRTLRRMQRGETLPAVPQASIAPGETFYTRDWNMARKRDLVRNFKDFKAAVLSGEYQKARAAITTVS